MLVRAFLDFKASRSCERSASTEVLVLRDDDEVRRHRRPGHGPLRADQGWGGGSVNQIENSIENWTNLRIIMMKIETGEAAAFLSIF